MTWYSLKGTNIINYSNQKDGSVRLRSLSEAFSYLFKHKISKREANQFKLLTNLLYKKFCNQALAIIWILFLQNHHTKSYFITAIILIYSTTQRNYQKNNPRVLVSATVNYSSKRPRTKTITHPLEQSNSLWNVLLPFYRVEAFFSSHLETFCTVCVLYRVCSSKRTR